MGFHMYVWVTLGPCIAFGGKAKVPVKAVLHFGLSHLEMPHAPTHRSQMSPVFLCY